MKMMYRHLIEKKISMLRTTIYSWIAAWKDGKEMADNKENQIEPQPNINFSRIKQHFLKEFNILLKFFNWDEVLGMIGGFWLVYVGLAHFCFKGI